MMEQERSHNASILQAQAGNSDIRNQIIKDYLPLIRQTVRRFTHVLIVDDLDEYSIALQAFDHALSRYRTDSPMSFPQFARLLMQNNLIDWTRQQTRKPRPVTLSQPTDDEQQPLQDRIADQSSSHIEAELEFRDSLLILQGQLKAFRLDYRKLSRKLPKHEKSRLLCIQLARTLCEQPDLRNHFWQKKRLPAKTLSEQSHTPLKTIERNRSTIIFYALLMQSDLEILKSCLRRYEREASL